MIDIEIGKTVMVTERHRDPREATVTVRLADADGAGLRQVLKVEPCPADPTRQAFNVHPAREWVTVAYADRHVEDRSANGSHEIEKAGPRPMVGA